MAFHRPGTRRAKICGGLVFCVSSAAVLFSFAAAPANEEQLWRHRNLGKALFETPTAIPQAVEELKKARDLAPDSYRDRLNYGIALLRADRLDEAIAELERAQRQQPGLPYTWFNLGVAYKRGGRHADAIRQFERMAEIVPGEPVVHYNLGILYNLTDREAEALKQFQTAARMDPKLVAPRSQIYNLYNLQGKDEEAAKAMADFLRAKEAQKSAGDSEDMDWCAYAELYDPIEAPPAHRDSSPGAELRFREVRLPGSFDGKTAGLLAIDAFGRHQSDLVAWSRSGVRLYRDGRDSVASSGLDGLQGVVSVAAADFDNDGLPDLCALTETGPVLFRNLKGRFQRQTAVQLPAERFDAAVWIDFDHDHDYDLFLFGKKSVVLRNENGVFRDYSARFPMVAGHAVAAAAFRSMADMRGIDIAVGYADRKGVLYRDRLRGEFEAMRLDGLPAGAESLRAVDVNNDGSIDLAFSSPAGTKVLFNRQGEFETAAAAASTPAAPAPTVAAPVSSATAPASTVAAPVSNATAPAPTMAAAAPKVGAPVPTAAALAPGAGAFVFADLESRGWMDLIAGNAAYRNFGAGEFAQQKRQPPFPAAAAWAAADFDGDGRVDLAAIDADGSLHLLINRTATQNSWLRTALTGIKNPKLAMGAEVEVKTGDRYQKKIYEGVPLLFGLGPHTAVDTVRIVWPNGMIQNQPDEARRSALYQEAPRMSGSCPLVFTWNGRRFEFISDVLGTAPLGASSGDGGYFPVNSREHLQIPATAMQPRNGRYEVSITEELHEVSFLDQIRLIAVDHDGVSEVLTNDKFKAPPFPEFRLFGVKRRIWPVRAADGKGVNLLPSLLRRDGVYARGFAHDANGVAEMHVLEMAFPSDAARDGRAILVLHGWIDWADGSTFLAAAQGRTGLVMPYLQVKDAGGRWRTAIEDMGVPSGGPKTIAIDLTGKFLSASREIRIVTNACVYWDEIFLSEETAPPQVRLSAVSPVATLTLRGFSKATIDPRREHPERYEYAAWQPAAMWNPIPGLYTRYGDVTELVGKVDDRFVIMGSGDELGLSFDAAGFPSLPAGWKRDFLLLVDGWSKDGDANTAFGDRVEPLPFHGMTRYPYAAPEKFPDDAAHREWSRSYNSRRETRVFERLAGTAAPRLSHTGK
jgi:tetratricopeptide (TPR) repeat protein